MNARPQILKEAVMAGVKDSAEEISIAAKVVAVTAVACTEAVSKR